MTCHEICKCSCEKEGAEHAKSLSGDANEYSEAFDISNEIFSGINISLRDAFFYWNVLQNKTMSNNNLIENSNSMQNDD